MKLYALCLLVLVIVVSFFASGCTAAIEPVRAPVDYTRPGETIVEFTPSKTRNVVHDILPMSVRRDTLVTVDDDRTSR